MRRVLAYLLLLLGIVSVSCDSDNTSNNSIVGWYANLNGFASTSGFDRINQAIDNNECIYTTGYSHNYDRYATRDLFFDNGRWSSTSAYYGTCRFLPAGYCNNVYRIIDKNTIEYYFAWLYDPDYVPSSAEIAGQVYAGRHFGTLVYYDDSPSYYTYVMVENKIIVSNGDIFTVTTSGLIKDGSSSILSKYDPEKSF